MLLSGLRCSVQCSSTIWGRARATRSSSRTWTSTLSRTWCGTSTVAGGIFSKDLLSLDNFLWFSLFRVSDLPDKSDLLLSAADKYDIRCDLEEYFALFVSPVNVSPSEIWRRNAVSHCQPTLLLTRSSSLASWFGSLLKLNEFLLYRWLTFWFSLTCTRLWSWNPQLYHFFLLTKRRSSANLTGR